MGEWNLSPMNLNANQPSLECIDERRQQTEAQIATLQGTEMLSLASDVTAMPLPREIANADPAHNCLLVAGDFGSWVLADSLTLQVYRTLAQPHTWASIAGQFGEAAVRAVACLWSHGLLCLNGRPIAPRWAEATELQGRQPNFIALHMTKGCNFRCRYCYNSSSQDNGGMEAYMAVRFLEKAFREVQETEFNVDFLGGEPLLVFDTIAAIMERSSELAQRYGKSIHFLMQTNGSLLSDERIELLRRYDVGVGVSLDGPPDLHDKYRLGANGAPTQALVLERLLAARRRGLNVSPLAVIHDPRQMSRILEYFVQDLGLRAMRFNHYNPLGRARELPDQPAFTPSDYARGFLAMVDRALDLAAELGEKLLIFDLCWMLRNLTAHSRPYMCMNSPCGLGEAIVALDPDGLVYGCEEYETRTRERLCLGHWEDINLGRLRETSPFWKTYQQRRVEDIPRCARCPVRRFCGGGCAHKALAFFGTWRREDPMCRFYRQAFLGLMGRIATDPRLLRYLA